MTTETSISTVSRTGLGAGPSEADGAFAEASISFRGASRSRRTMAPLKKTPNSSPAPTANRTSPPQIWSCHSTKLRTKPRTAPTAAPTRTFRVERRTPFAESAQEKRGAGGATAGGEVVAANGGGAGWT